MIPRVVFRSPVSPVTKTCARCVRDGRPKRAAHWHHWLTQQRIRMYVGDWAMSHGLTNAEAGALLKRLLHDRRNLTALCVHHHLDTRMGAPVLTRDDIPAPAWEFAIELGLKHSLERAYPVR